MNFDPESLKATVLGLGMVRDVETGEVRWGMIAAGILVASTVAVGGFIVKMGNVISAIEARQQVVFSRLESVENVTHPATMKRYTSDDAARDFELMRVRMREIRDEARKDHEELVARLQRIEDKVRR